jgi:hypothetical protein
VRGAWVHIHDFDGESWGFSDHYWMNTAYLYNLSIYDSSNPTYYSIKGDYRAGQYNYDDWSVRYDNKDMRDKQFNSILIAMYNSNL